MVKWLADMESVCVGHGAGAGVWGAMWVGYALHTHLNYHDPSNYTNPYDPKGWQFLFALLTLAISLLIVMCSNSVLFHLWK